MWRSTLTGALALLVGCSSPASSGPDAASDADAAAPAVEVDADSAADDTTSPDAGPDVPTAPDAVADAASDDPGSEPLPDVPPTTDVTPDAGPAEPPPDATTDASDAPAAEDVPPEVVEPTGPAGPCPLNTRVGRFEIADHGLYAAVNGNVADGVIPLTVLQPVGQGGDCVLMQKTNPFCDPSCAAGELCGHDNTCSPFPANRDVGTVTVQGLKVPIELTPNASNDYWDTTLPPEPWDVGAAVTFSTSGGDYAPFAMAVEGVTPLVGGESKWQVNEGEATVVEWVPSDGPGRMFLTLNVDQHGITPVTLFCDTEDTGSLTIPSTLVNQFLSFGVTGFAVGQLRRRSIDSLEIEPGCVEVSLFSPWVAQPVVEGHTACNGDFDCPEGQKCNIFINTCVDE